MKLRGLFLAIVSSLGLLSCSQRYQAGTAIPKALQHHCNRYASVPRGIEGYPDMSAQLGWHGCSSLHLSNCAYLRQLYSFLSTSPPVSPDSPTMQSIAHAQAQLSNLQKKHNHPMTGSVDVSRTQQAGTYARIARDWFNLDRAPQGVQACEIGFNAGLSATLFLVSNSKLRYHAWDDGQLEAAAFGRKVLKSRFPGRSSLEFGPSQLTVPAATRFFTQCELLSVDGSHDYPVVMQDITNFRSLARKHAHVLLLDDIRGAGVNKAVWEHFCNGTIIIVRAITDGRRPFVVAAYV